MNRILSRVNLPQTCGYDYNILYRRKVKIAITFEKHLFRCSFKICEELILIYNFFYQLIQSRLINNLFVREIYSYSIINNPNSIRYY